jgi:hypothetical protein
MRFSKNTCIIGRRDKVLGRSDAGVFVFDFDTANDGH